ncbi:MAG: DUF3108 domain-containing protein [Burkholderiaceae bacterium]|nr:DUF3108 domain-containing protein [Burkholderiaceae bacterium]MDO9089743.1 DUF3108 domain-containing protein [Burkholderiaceae bacterium]
MARSAKLGALLLAVLLAHGLALEWLASQWQMSHTMQTMVAPMLTRQLLPETPAPPPEPAPAPAIQTAAAPGPLQAAAALPAAEAPTPAASSPQAAASTPAAPDPQVTASEPAVPAAPTPTIALAAAATGPADTPTSAPTSSPTLTTPAIAIDTPAARTIDAWPPDTRLSYRVSGHFRGPIQGSAWVEWLHTEDHRYQVRLEVDIGLVSVGMASQGLVTAQGLFPKAYEEITRALMRRRVRSVKLDDRNITLQDGASVPRPASVQDTASQFVELTHRFATGKSKLQAGESVSFSLARPGGVDVWTYDISEAQTLDTPFLGALTVHQLQPRKIDKPRGDIQAEIWFASSLAYLPARIRITQGEDSHLDLVIERIEQK